jgi:dipeptidase D
MKHLEPKALWQQFDALCQVPRPSKKEEKMIRFLQEFGAKHHLETLTDSVGNVVIRKRGASGYENHPTVVLQSHMDMVCEKNSDTVHNFDTDPIRPYIDGEWLKAQGTTLGADNGIGVAAQLAILVDDTLKHPPLECLFTVDEETGLTGAFALKSDVLTGATLLNLDSEDDGEFFIGCAGGIDTTVVFHYQPCPADDQLYYASLSVKGLLGGHSGDDIDKGRANANKLLARILWEVQKNTTLTLVSFNGGNLHNALPREATAVIGVPAEYKEDLRALFNRMTVDFENEFIHTEPHLKTELATVPLPEQSMDAETATALIYALCACPHGIIRMSDNMPGLVETSTNLASVKMQEGHTIRVATSQRSSVASAKLDIARTVESVFCLAGATVTHGDGYPGWNPNPESKIANLVADTYRQLFGKEPKIRAIHAGLECGLLCEKYPEMDMVSLGPTMRGVHSPDERLHIGDTQKFWTLLLAVLEKL